MSRQERLAARLDRQLPAVAAALARGVRTGATLPLAMAELAEHVEAPAGDELQAVVASIQRGIPLDDALERWRRTRPSASVALLVAACRFGHREGGDLGAALDGAAVSLLDGVEVAAEARALSTQARTSAAVLVALPVLGAVGFSLLDPAVAQTLFTTVPGWICLAAGSTLDALGAWVLARMVRSATA